MAVGVLMHRYSLQRGEAMADLLRNGSVPSRAMLRHWVLHDDATQLAMEALEKAGGVIRRVVPGAGRLARQQVAPAIGLLPAVVRAGLGIRPPSAAWTSGSRRSSKPM